MEAVVNPARLVGIAVTVTAAGFLLALVVTFGGPLVTP
jgi:hypothetical protein